MFVCLYARHGMSQQKHVFPCVDLVVVEYLWSVGHKMVAKCLRLQPLTYSGTVVGCATICCKPLHGFDIWLHYSHATFG